MITLIIAIILALLICIAEILDWIGRLEIIEKRWPKVYATMNSRLARLVAMLFLIALIARDIEQRTKVPGAPRITFQTVPAPIVQSSKCPVVQGSEESPESLRRRTVELVNDISTFWSRHPSPPGTYIQNPTTGEEREHNAAMEQYTRTMQADYSSAGFYERILGLVREYKAKGVPIGWLEKDAEQPERLFGWAPYGIPGDDIHACFLAGGSDLCQLQELAYHVDANDKPILLTPQKR